MSHGTAARLPSLDLVRGFVAVGRRMSITLAARDLHLTQSAVSRQVHALEAQLGTRLLVRGHRAIAFTPDGERLFRSADPAVRQLHDVLGELGSRGRVRPVTVSAAIGFTGLWLLPRLRHFQALHPDVDVRVAAHNRVVDLRNDGIDLAIRYTSTERVPPGARLLFPESVVPVASPSLRIRSLDPERVLRGQTLLEFDDARYPWLQWRPWLAANGREAEKPRAFLHFNQYDLVIQAALAGQGVALGRRSLIASLLEDGRLVELAAPVVPDVGGYGFWLLQAEASPRPEVIDVARWIVREAAVPAGDGPEDKGDEAP